MFIKKKLIHFDKNSGEILRRNLKNPNGRSACWRWFSKPKNSKSSVPSGRNLSGLTHQTRPPHTRTSTQFAKRKCRTLIFARNRTTQAIVYYTKVEQRCALAGDF